MATLAHLYAGQVLTLPVEAVWKWLLFGLPPCRTIHSFQFILYTHNSGLSNVDHSINHSCI